MLAQYIILKFCAILNLGSNQRLFLQGDIDKDGYLDYGEFVAISVHLRKMDNDDGHLRKPLNSSIKKKPGILKLRSYEMP